jgi:hypothetical protein
VCTNVDMTHQNLFLVNRQQNYNTWDGIQRMRQQMSSPLYS